MKAHDYVKIILVETNGSGPHGAWQRPADFVGELLKDVIVGRPIMAVEREPGQNGLRTSRVFRIDGNLVRTANSVYRIEPCPS